MGLWSRRIVLRVVSVSVVAVALLRCYTPTEMVIEIRTDLECTASKPRTRVLVGAETVAETEQCAAASGESLIGTLTFIPSGARDERSSVEVILAANGARVEDCAAQPANCISAKRAFSYIEHTARRLPIRLERACLGKVCPTDQTCVSGVCVAIAATCQGDCTNPVALTGDGGKSSSGADASTSCTAGETRCDGPRLESCGPNGVFGVVATCATRELCALRIGEQCGAVSCTPGAAACDGNRALRCDATGSKMIEVGRCTSPGGCAPDGGGDGGCFACSVGEAYCDSSCTLQGGPTTDDCIRRCNATQSGFDYANCGYAQSSGFSDSCVEPGAGAAYCRQ